MLDTRINFKNNFHLYTLAQSNTVYIHEAIFACVIMIPQILSTMARIPKTYVAANVAEIVCGRIVIII